eukprot:Em0005g1302a
MPSRNRKKRTKQRAEYLQKQEENKAKARERYKADPEKKKASVRESYKADPENKKASVRESYKADPEKKKASVRESYKADPEKKKASVRESYKADPEKKKASVRESYKADPEKKKASVRESYKADPEKKKASTPGSAPKAKAKRKKNSAGSPVEEQRNEFLKGTRKGRRVLDVQKKLDVIEMLDKGKTQREVAAQLGVSKTQVLNISRCRAALYKRQLTSKVAKFGKFADIDKAVFDWFCRVRTPVGLRKPLPVSLAALQARARHEARLRNVHNFKASVGGLGDGVSDLMSHQVFTSMVKREIFV